MSRQDNIRRSREAQRQLQAAASQPVPFRRRLILQLEKNRKRFWLLLGSPGLLDVMKEFLRGKLMDRAFGYLGPLGQWLKAYPVAFFTIGLVIAMLVLIVATIRESSVLEQSVICDEHGAPYIRQRVAPPWTFKLSIAFVVCMGLILYGTYRYYQISIGHFKVNPNTNVTLPELPREPPFLLALQRPPSLADLFAKDFTVFIKAANGITLEGVDVAMTKQVYLDFSNKIKFVGFYIPAYDPTGDRTSKMCLMLTAAVQPALELPRGHIMTGLQGRTIQELAFTGKVVLYHEDVLTLNQKVEIINAYKAKNWDAHFYGPDYLADQTELWRHLHLPASKSDP